MNRPIPPATAANRCGGMAATISWRTPAKVSTRNATPEMKTQPSATGQGTPIALDHGEAEIGVQPHARRQRERHVGEKPIRMQAKPAARQVAAATAATGMPAWPRIAGLTSTI